MMRLYGTFLLAVALVGCRVTPDATVLPAVNAEAPSVVPAAIAEMPAQGLPGKVLVSIQWPGAGGRGIQAMPDSVQGVRVSIEKVAGQPLAAQWVKRGSGQVTTVALEAPSGEGYRIRAAAYSGWNETDPGKLLADGVAAQVTVPWGKVARVTLDLTPVNMPRIVSVDLAAAGPGAQLDLGVAGAGEATSGVVIFPSGREVDVALASGAASVKVPQDAGVGSLRLRVDGILSAQGPVFRQLRDLRIVALDDPSNELPGPRNDPDDKAIHLWPGAASPLVVAGTDVEGVDVPEVRGVVWSRALPGPYSLSDSGRVVCLSLGRGRIRAASGNLTTDRDLELAPFEGPVVMLDGPSDGNHGPRAVVLDENRLLVLWRNADLGRLRWRIVTRMSDGNLSVGATREIPGSGVAEERVAAAAAGQSVVGLFHRQSVTVNGAVRSTLYFNVLDKTTGELLASPSFFIPVSELYDGYHLGSMAAQGDNFQLAYNKWDGSIYANQWFNIDVTMQPEPTWTMNNGLKVEVGKAARGPMVDSAEVVPGPAGSYLFARTYQEGTSNPMYLSALTASGSNNVLTGWSFDRAVSQPAIAHDGNHYLVVRYVDGTAGPSVEASRYRTDTLASVDFPPVFLEAVRQPAWVVGLRPTSAMYDPVAGRFVAGYSRAIPGVEPTGVTEGYQSVVRIIDPATGKPEGPSFPMQARSHSGTVVPGWAVYIRDGAVMVRHLKLK
ncbi:MAG: hypothetical protein FJY99_07545 [Candidatus Sericytochromatia bacterium]|nr:hypothetical protein [Candidatus Tanganyikabacteria bacterium]